MLISSTWKTVVKRTRFEAAWIHCGRNGSQHCQRVMVETMNPHKCNIYWGKLWLRDMSSIQRLKSLPTVLLYVISYCSSGTSNKTLSGEQGNSYILGKKALTGLKLLLQDNPLFCWQAACFEANYKSFSGIFQAIRGWVFHTQVWFWL